MRAGNTWNAAVAAGLALLCLLVSSCGGSDGSDSSASEQSVATPTAPSGGKIENHLTNSDRRRAALITRRDPKLEAVLGSRQRRLADLVPVTSANGTELEGVVVTVMFEPAIRFDHRSLPAEVPPNRLAPPGTPTIRRSYRCTATGITKLEVRVDLDTSRVVEIVPAGPRAKIAEMQLMGPPLGRFYMPISED
jgi:hypothetical protein